jgi:hypothetical protein
MTAPKSLEQIRDELAIAHDLNPETYARGSAQSICVNTFKAGFDACLKMLSEKAAENFDEVAAKAKAIEIYDNSYRHLINEVFVEGARRQHEQAQAQLEIITHDRDEWRRAHSDVHDKMGIYKKVLEDVKNAWGKGVIAEDVYQWVCDALKDRDK